jgi:hypothetical protein
MDAGLSRATITRKRDPHSWNSWDHYRTINDKRLAEHPFVDSSQPNSLKWEMVEIEGYPLMRHAGQVYCIKNVILEVEKLFETTERNGKPYIRGLVYRYAAWIPGGHNVLRYHNLHGNLDEFHHRIFDPLTGEETFYEPLTRLQFPTFAEVLNEMEIICVCLTD